MEVVRALLRFLSYLYHGLLCLVLVVLSGLAILAGAPTLRMEMLPWTGSTLIYVMLGGGLFGFLILILAIKGVLRPLFFLWALVVVIMMIKGYLLSNYHFSPGEFTTVIYMIVGSLIALLGAWFVMTARPDKKRM